jgi:uncharacterized protein (DUF924 family)
MAGIRSAIKQLTEQVADGCEIETDALEEEKLVLTGQKKEISEQQQEIHTCLATDRTICLCQQSSRNLYKINSSMYNSCCKASHIANNPTAKCNDTIFSF